MEYNNIDIEDFISKIDDLLSEDALIQCYFVVFDYFNNKESLKKECTNDLVLLTSEKDKVQAHKKLSHKENLKKNLLYFRDLILQYENELSRVKATPIFKDKICVENRIVALSKINQFVLQTWIGKLVMIEEKIKKSLNLSNVITVKNDIGKSRCEVSIRIDFDEYEIEFYCYGDEDASKILLRQLKEPIQLEIKSQACLKIFISYSHDDEHWKDAIKKSLATWWQEEKVKIWDDRQIDGGDDWNRKILENLQDSQIVLLLISPEFVASNFCYNIETEIALVRHNKKEARIIPIFTRRMSDEDSKISHIQGYPQDKKPLSKFGKVASDNEGVYTVSTALGKIFKSIRLTGKIVE